MKELKIFITITIIIIALVSLPVFLMQELKDEMQIQIDELKAQIQGNEAPDVDSYIADLQEQIDAIRDDLTVMHAEPTPTIEPTPTPEPFECDKELLKVVQLEAGYSGGYDCYLAIASVVFNQLENGYWGDNLHEVLSRPFNFSVYDYNHDWILADKCKQACIDATNGKRYFSDDVYFFRTESSYKAMRNKSDYEVVLVKWGIVFMRHAK